MFWRPNKEDITQWIERKKQDLAREHYRNPRLNDEQWLQRYVFTDLHEIFFGEFSIILTEWIERILENIGKYWAEALRNWTPELIRQLNTISNTISCVVDFWLNSILGDYITKFSIDYTQSYSVIERKFFKGPRGRYLNALSTWIKMLLCENNLMKMESDT
jgi:hypothetical protein